MSPTIACPKCGCLHALFWKFYDTGRPVLKYHCNRVWRVHHTAQGAVAGHYTTDERLVGKKGSPETKPYEDLTIPEVWSKSKAKNHQSDSQPVFPI